MDAFESDERGGDKEEGEKECECKDGAKETTVAEVSNRALHLQGIEEPGAGGYGDPSHVGGDVDLHCERGATSSPSLSHLR